MTNEQLAILLRGYYSRLVSILNQLSDDLEDVEDLECHQVQVNLFSLEDKQTRRGTPICLDDLDNFQDDLMQDIGDLLNTDYKRMKNK